MDPTDTTIKISLNTRDALRRIGRKGQTYNDIIIHLVKKAKKCSANFPELTEPEVL